MIVWGESSIRIEYFNCRHIVCSCLLGFEIYFETTKVIGSLRDDQKTG